MSRLLAYARAGACLPVPVRENPAAWCYDISSW